MCCTEEVSSREFKRCVIVASLFIVVMVLVGFANKYAGDFCQKWHIVGWALFLGPLCNVISFGIMPIINMAAESECIRREIENDLDGSAGVCFIIAVLSAGFGLLVIDSIGSI